MQNIVTKFRAMPRMKQLSNIVLACVYVFAGIAAYLMLTTSNATRWTFIFLVVFWFLPVDAQEIDVSPLQPRDKGQPRPSLWSEVKSVYIDFFRDIRSNARAVGGYILRRHILNRTMILGIFVIIGAEEFARQRPEQMEAAVQVIAFTIVWIIADQLLAGMTSSFVPAKQKPDVQ